MVPLLPNLVVKKYRCVLGCPGTTGRGGADARASTRQCAVEALHILLPCGSTEFIRELAAFRGEQSITRASARTTQAHTAHAESNVVDMNAFYHGETRINYMAKLVADDHPRVRRAFYAMLCDWCLNLPERADYGTRARWRHIREEQERH
jgi:hypothetical protein